MEKQNDRKSNLRREKMSRINKLLIALFLVCFLPLGNLSCGRRHKDQRRPDSHR